MPQFHLCLPHMMFSWHAACEGACVPSSCLMVTILFYARVMKSATASAQIVSRIRKCLLLNDQHWLYSTASPAQARHECCLHHTASYEFLWLIMNSIGSSCALRGLTTSISSSACFIGKSIWSGLLSSVTTSYLNVFIGLHHCTSSMNFVKWQTSRSVSNCVQSRLHRWSSAILDCLSLATEPFWLPLLVME